MRERLTRRLLAPVLALAVCLLAVSPGATAEEPIGVPEGKPGLADYAFTRAMELVREGETDTAMQLLHLAVSSRPEVALYREALGDLYLARGTEQGAVLAMAEYEAALAAEPGRARAMRGLAQAAMLAGRTGVALDVLEGMLRPEGELRLSLVPDLAALYLMVDRVPRGISVLEGVRAEAPAQARAVVTVYLATLYRYADRRGDALNALLAVTADENAPEDLRAHVRRLAADWRREWERAE